MKEKKRLLLEKRDADDPPESLTSRIEAHTQAGMGWFQNEVVCGSVLTPQNSMCQEFPYPIGLRTSVFLNTKALQVSSLTLE